MLQSDPRPHVLLALGWYDHEINLGVATFARKAGWVLNDLFGHAGHLPPSWTGDGVITLLNEKDSKLTNYVHKLRVPVVDLVCEIPKIRVARVIPDNAAIGRIGAEHLLACGVRHLAFLTLGTREVERERCEGFRDAVTHAAAQFHHLNFKGQPHDMTVEDDLIPWLAKQLKTLPKPLGAMGQHDREAIFLLEAAERAGLTVPDSIAVVGVDNDPVCCELGPLPLSSVDRRRFDQGYEAAALLGRMISGEAAPKEPIRIAPGAVVVRRSSDLLAVKDPLLADALRYIAEHHHKPIDVSDVVKASGTTRRNLYRLFEEHLGRAIKTEIDRRRIERAKTLLIGTEQKLFAVALATGFRNVHQFSKTFSREVGSSPGQFRQQFSRAHRDRCT